jgi:anionic cell wall polymer biosynthesis LytR-Cps2A-Psr (LCP) family protein
MNGRHPGPPTPQVGSDPGHNSLFDSSAAGAPVVDAEPREESAPDPPARRGRTRRVIAILALALILLVGLLGSALYISVQNLSSNITRVPDVFSALDGAERPAPVDNRVSFLVMGTDSRHATGRRGDDVLMLARVDVDLDPTTTGASVVSIPRDSWVDVPERGRDKISAAYGHGGPTLLVRTVEKLTDVRIDHFAIIDFAGFQEMVNAVGGIDVGNNHLDGRGALDYVGGGSWAPAGYADRLRRQQTALRALLDKAASSGLLADPIQLLRLLDALSRAVSVDETLSNGSLQELGLQMHGLRTSAVQFLGCPTAGLGQEGGQSVVYLDGARSAELWEALRTDTVQEYARRYPGDVLVAPPR